MADNEQTAEPPRPSSAADASDPAAGGAPAGAQVGINGAIAESVAAKEPPVAARRELTVRAVVTAMVVAVIVGASYPYVVLKIGYGPNISVVSAFFGYIALTIIAFFTGIRGTRWENNIVQTAGTAAGEAGFMCVVL